MAKRKKKAVKIYSLEIQIELAPDSRRILSFLREHDIVDILKSSLKNSEEFKNLLFNVGRGS